MGLVHFPDPGGIGIRVGFPPFVSLSVVHSARMELALARVTSLSLSSSYFSYTHGDDTTVFSVILLPPYSKLYRRVRLELELREQGVSPTILAPLTN